MKLMKQITKWSALPALLAAALLIAASCENGPDGTGTSMEAITTTPADLIFYELEVPTGEEYAYLHEMGIGLYPHAKAVEGDWMYLRRYVTLLDREGVDFLTTMGYSLEMPRRSSFTDIDWDQIMLSPTVTLSSAEILAADANPEDPVTVGFVPLGTRSNFCQYDISDYPCDISIQEEMEAFEAAHPGYVQLVTMGYTKEARPIYAMRIGKITTQEDPDSPVLFYVAGQHAREWITTEMAMKVMRYYADAYRDNQDGVPALLSDKTLVVVPVANPDGYQYTHDAVRLWRKNRNPDPGCAPPNIGVDPNRNFYYTWGQPGASDTCGGQECTYRGFAAGSELETGAMRSLVFNSGVTPAGKYRPAALLNLHAYGNLVMWPDGNGSPDAEGKNCNTWSNCMAPDHGAQRYLLGSEYKPCPWLVDEVKGTPYPTDSLLRNLYELSGGLDGEAMMGDPMGSRNCIAACLELTFTAETFFAENLPESQVEALYGNQKEFVRYMLDNLIVLDNDKFFTEKVGYLSFGSVERRCYEQGESACWQSSAQRPRFYVSALKTLSGVNIDPAPGYSGTQSADLTGFKYKLYRWKPATDFLFPPWIKVCANQVPCSTISIDGSTDKVDLGDPDYFERSGFTWNATDKYWYQTGGVGSYLKRKYKDAKHSVATHLFFSYRSGSGYVIKVIVKYAGSSKTVRIYPRDYAVNPPGRRFRTESIDVGFVDKKTNVNVSFLVSSGPSTPPPSGKDFQVGDVVFVGRHVP
jgi:hypothetical protein